MIKNKNNWHVIIHMLAIPNYKRKHKNNKQININYSDILKLCLIIIIIVMNTLC